MIHTISECTPLRFCLNICEIMAREVTMKRMRGTNFSSFEKELLIELVNKYKEIIECKKTDGLKIKEKDETWDKLRDEYNSNGSVTSRTTKQLRQFYVNLKRSAKKARSDERVERYKTGGGQCTTKVDESVLSLIEDQIEPNSNPFDCDSEYYGDAEIITTEQEARSCDIVEVIAVVHEENVNRKQLSLEDNTASLEMGTPGPASNTSLLVTPVAEALTGAENCNKQQTRVTKANLCRNNIAALAESRTTLCEKEMYLIQQKYNQEQQLLKMKMETEKLKQEAFREKLMYYKEKRKRVEDE
ncbi:myb/SANT-like DNA-binding domain-containing protein 3 [Periplaneta americana]|uniref:myb/SANT-like DNA-binding domain-containing protein 3 n=1 Tax=Periplaneta americana TaxID=6978 RepID=UPI0037E772B8